MTDQEFLDIQKEILEYEKTDPMLSDWIEFCIARGIVPQLQFIPITQKITSLTRCLEVVK